MRREQGKQKLKLKVCRKEKLTLETNPKTPEKKCDTNDKVPFATPMPSFDGLFGLRINSRNGSTTKSCAPFMIELTAIVGFPKTSTDPSIL